MSNTLTLFMRKLHTAPHCTNTLKGFVYRISSNSIGVPCVGVLHTLYGLFAKTFGCKTFCSDSQQCEKRIQKQAAKKQQQGKISDGK